MERRQRFRGIEARTHEIQDWVGRIGPVIVPHSKLGILSEVPEDAAAAASAETAIISGAVGDPAMAWLIPQRAASAITPAK
jgi:hypothetical protein